MMATLASDTLVNLEDPGFDGASWRNPDSIILDMLQGDSDGPPKTRGAVKGSFPVSVDYLRF